MNLHRRIAVLERLTEGQHEARLVLQEASDAAFNRLADLIVREIGPLALAEAAVDGSYVQGQVQRLVLDSRGGDQPIRHMAVQHAIRTSAPPADFERAGMIAQRLAHAVQYEA